MIWNGRGSEQFDFYKIFFSLLDYHRPTMVFLLETHRTHYQYLEDEFSFIDVVNVPSIRDCGERL